MTPISITYRGHDTKLARHNNSLIQFNDLIDSGFTADWFSKCF